MHKRINGGIFAILAVLFVGVMAISSSTPASANILNRGASWLDDNCYSTPSVASTMGQQIGGLFGNGNIIGNFGMVNAIVRVPIYDWDQTPPLPMDFSDPTNLSDSHVPSFGPPRVRPIGYLEYFSATVTPVPNIQWMQEYATKQAPYDLSILGSLVGGGGSVREPNPFIANPLLYQRASIIHPNGRPNLSFSNPNFEDRSGQGESHGGISEGDFMNLDDAYGLTNGDIIADELGPEVIEDLYNDPGQYNNQTASSGFNFMATPFSVNKNNPGDNCREWLSNNSPMVPSYAFSVPSANRIPITYPGTLITPITYFAGFGVSSSGITTYPNSVNGKMMLDCYGRGLQPTVVATNHSIGRSPEGSFNLLGARIPRFDRWQGFLYFAAFTIDNAISGGSNQDIIRLLPMPKVVRENYFNGMAYLFNVQRPEQVDLPEALRDREIDFRPIVGSKLTSVNMQVLTSRNGGHSDSNNGSTYYPNLYVKLKKPYKHIPTFGSAEQKIQDGSSVAVQPRIQKDGFSSSPRYNDGGNRNDAPRPNSAVARIVEVILEPGQHGAEIRDQDFEGAELGDTNGIYPDQLCAFMRDRLGDPEAGCVADRPELGGTYGINITDLPGSDGIDRTNTFNLVAENGGVIDRKIPAETEPGTKFCYAVYLHKQDNDLKYSDEDYYRNASNYNPNYSARKDKRYLSRSHCIISGYKPSFQVRGGDLISGGVVHTETNTKEYLANPNTLRKYGSWVEYGVIASNSIEKLASGAGYRIGMPAGNNDNPPEGTPPSDGVDAEDWVNTGPLSFSNNRSEDSMTAEHGNFGEVSDGFGHIVDQFSELASTGQPLGSNVDISTLEGGVYLLGDGETRFANEEGTENSAIGEGKSIVLLAPQGATINIAQNIQLQESYPNESLLSQVVIAPLGQNDAFTVNIHSDVSRVDSWLVNPSGTINTCYLETDNVGDQTPRGYDWGCYNTLIVNGPVSADTLLLRRSGSRDQNEVPPFTLEQSVAGENFNLRPDAYIWAANYVSDFGRKLITTNLLDLPPRF